MSLVFVYMKDVKVGMEERLGQRDGTVSIFEYKAIVEVLTMTSFAMIFFQPYDSPCSSLQV